jgi:NADPH:quinone reductase-like Zn-dependent oxidoreductase
MDTMMAVRAHQRGGPEVLVYESAPIPRPGAGEVLVEVHAAAITFAELSWDETWSHLPTVPSHEFSGVVSALGDDVRATDVGDDVSLDIGDEVYGLIRFDRDGAAAQFVTVAAVDIARRPEKVSHVVSAALPLAALTAWQALVDHAQVKPGERVLVHGGAGGVGAFVTQLAARLGAEVTATTLGPDVDTVRSLGAHRVLDVRTDRFDDQPARYDVVIDTVGGETLDRSFAVLRRGGRLVTLAAPPSAERCAQFGVNGTFFIVTPDRSELTQLAELADRGELTVAIAATYPLADARTAYESGRTFDRPPGKTVLIVRD